MDNATPSINRKTQSSHRHSNKEAFSKLAPTISSYPTLYHHEYRGEQDGRFAPEFYAAVSLVAVVVDVDIESLEEDSLSQLMREGEKGCFKGGFCDLGIFSMGMIGFGFGRLTAFWWDGV